MDLNKSVHYTVNMYTVDRIRKLIENFKIIQNYNGNIEYDKLIAPLTTFKIGGKADIFCEPFDIDSFVKLVIFLKQNSIPFFILAGASNLVVSDEGFDEVVISTRNISFINISSKNENKTNEEVILECGCGTFIKQITEYCINNNLLGFERFSGLPGTIGGATFMNARCFDVSISDVFKSATFLDLVTNKVCMLDFIKEDWDYKKSPFQDKNKVILSVKLKTVYSKEDIKQKCDYYIEERKKRGHFDYPSAGSVFKNNRNFGSPSGKIIDDLGLRGTVIGGAKIADFHGNFIINTGNASQKDVKNLVEFIVNTVKAKKNILLESEIIFCGKNTNN